MPRRRTPADAELQILHVLWARGPGTAREVATALNREHAYTTVLKLLQIMTEKKLVARDESARSHVYRAAVSAAHTQQQMVSYIVDRLFDGSAAKLVLSALSSHKASAEELAEITSGGQRASVEQDAVRETINICNRAGVGLYPVDARGIPASQSPGDSPGIQPFR